MATAWTTADIPDLGGKTILVTGANSGLGYETALALAGRGASAGPRGGRSDLRSREGDRYRDTG